MNCKDCKHYEKDPLHKGFGKCSSGQIQYEGNETFKYFRGKYITIKENKTKLLYTDYNGYSARHLVGKNFGCIHFKEKQSEGSNIQEQRKED